jgi:hypothetical protein
MSPSASLVQVIVPPERARALPDGLAAAVTGLPPRLCRRLRAAGHGLPVQPGVDAHRAAARLGPGGLAPALRAPRTLRLLGVAAVGLAVGIGAGASLPGGALWWLIGSAAPVVLTVLELIPVGRDRAAQAERAALLAGQALPGPAAAVEAELLATAAAVLAADLAPAVEDEVLHQLAQLMDALTAPEAPLSALRAAAATLAEALHPAAPDAADPVAAAAALADRLRASRG